MARTKRKAGRIGKSDEQRLKMLAVYLPEKTIERIEKLADADTRSLGNMGRKMIDYALPAFESGPAGVPSGN